MMHDREKSNSAIVATKPTNKAGATAAEPVEPRAGTKRNVGEQSTHQTLGWVRVSQALDRVRKTSRQGEEGEGRSTQQTPARRPGQALELKLTDLPCAGPRPKSFIFGRAFASPPDTRGKSRMP